MVYKLDEERPDPELILSDIKKEEKRSKGGKLKIFFGMSAGVGKTYAMLQEAHRLQKEGIDVAVGIINTHGRKETAALVQGLKIIPEKIVPYKDTVFQELDIDEILKIKPQLILVDELAHTNVPGSRHSKRWQDVMELLDAGIDVATTLNVQHVESRKDVVEGITGIQIRETVPDVVIERANAIELVDITPDELLQRLHEGKVYIGDQSLIAAENFFKAQSLVALREIALRLTAEKVDHDLHGIYLGWRTRERLMVAVSHSPNSQKLIRAARRLAFELDAPWIAVYVDTGMVLNNVEQARLVINLNLARDLGAEVITIQDLDIADGLHRIAKQKNVSQILVGRPTVFSVFDYFKSSLIDKLVENNPHADIVVIRQDLVSGIYQRTINISTQRPAPLLSYGIAALSVMISTIVGYLLLPWVEYRVVGFIYLLNIILLGLFQSQGPIILAGFLSTILWNFLFIPPIMSFEVVHVEDIRLLLAFFIVTCIVGLLSNRIREKERLLTLREESNRALFDIEKEIAQATSIHHLKMSVTNKLQRIFHGQFTILVKNPDEKLSLEGLPHLLNDEKEKGVANWVFKHDKIAGWSTDTLPASRGLYFPIRGFGETVGVLVYEPKSPRPLTITEINFIETVNQQVGVYIQRALTKDKIISNAYIQDVEKAQEAIFHSFSHNINIPLSQLSKSIDDLKTNLSDEKKANVLIKQMEKGLGNLKMLVKNILAMSKLSSGLIHFEKTKQNIEEVIRSSIEKLKNPEDKKRCHIKMTKNFPDVLIDRQLMELALYNLIVNAIDYSPSSKPVTITVEEHDDELRIFIRDEGPGIPKDILPHIFEKFYQADVPGADSTGLGLGLAVTKAIADMHQGQLEAKNRPEGGAELIFILKKAQ